MARDIYGNVIPGTEEKGSIDNRPSLNRISDNVSNMSEGQVTFTQGGGREPEYTNVFLQNPFYDSDNPASGPSGVYTNFPGNYFNQNPFVFTAQDQRDEGIGGMEVGGPLNFDSIFYSNIDTNPEGIGFQQFNLAGTTDNTEAEETKKEQDRITSIFSAAMGYDRDPVSDTLRQIQEQQEAQEAFDYGQDLNNATAEDLEAMGFEMEEPPEVDILDTLKGYQENLDATTTEEEEFSPLLTQFDFDTFSIGTESMQGLPNGKELRPIFSNIEGSENKLIGSAVYDPENDRITGYGITDDTVDLNTLNIRQTIEEDPRLGFGGIKATASPEETAQKLADPDVQKKLASAATYKAASKILKQLDTVYQFSAEEKASINEKARGMSDFELKSMVQKIVDNNNNPNFNLNALYSFDDRTKMEVPSLNEISAFQMKAVAGVSYAKKVVNPVTGEVTFPERTDMPQKYQELYGGEQRSFNDFDGNKLEAYAFAAQSILGLPDIGGAGKGNFTNISGERLRMIESIIENPREGIRVFYPQWKGDLNQLVTTDNNGRVIGGNVEYTKAQVTRAISNIVQNQLNAEVYRKALTSQKNEVISVINQEFNSLEASLKSSIINFTETGELSMDSVTEIRNFTEITRRLNIAQMSPTQEREYQYKGAQLLTATVEPVLNGLMNQLTAMNVNGLNFTREDFDNTEDYNSALKIKADYLNTFNQLKESLTNLTNLTTEAPPPATAKLFDGLNTYLTNVTPSDVDESGNFTNTPIASKKTSILDVFGPTKQSIELENSALGLGLTVPKGSLTDAANAGLTVDTNNIVTTNARGASGDKIKNFKGTSEQLFEQLNQEANNDREYLTNIEDALSVYNQELKLLNARLDDPSTTFKQIDAIKIRIKDFEKMSKLILKEKNRVEKSLKTPSQVRSEQMESLVSSYRGGL